MLPVADPLPARELRSETSTRGLMRRIRSSIRLASAILRASPSAINGIAIRTSEDQDCKYVSPKVIVAKVFYGRARQEGLDAQAVQDHGSHTAGIAAGVTGKTAVVNGVSVGDMSGIAPGAWLGNYNVFPGAVLNARDVDIASAVEAAVEDGMDVLNLSLGGSYTGKEQNDMLSSGSQQRSERGRGRGGGSGQQWTRGIHS